MATKCYQTRQDSPFERKIARHTIIIRLLLGALGCVVIGTFSLDEIRDLFDANTNLTNIIPLGIRLCVVITAAGWVFATSVELSTLRRWLDTRNAKLPPPTGLIIYGVVIITCLAGIAVTADSYLACIWWVVAYSAFDLFVGLISKPLIGRICNESLERIEECTNKHPKDGPRLKFYSSGVILIRDSMVGTTRFIILSLVLGGALTCALLTLSWPHSVGTASVGVASAILLFVSSIDAFLRLIIRDHRLHSLRTRIEEIENVEENSE